jgi:septal ring-binding cell division protein DamX
MRHSNRFLSTVLAIGVVAALALGSVSQAAEARKAAHSPAAKHQQATDLKVQRAVKRAGGRVPTESASFNFERLDAAFNPKEFTIDVEVPSQRK